MKFHFCKEGETLLSIAREEGISPVRLIEENALSDPDRLAVGQCLAIYSASRIYTVRGADTIGSISSRLGCNPLDLIRLNPAIGERGLLYPGQSLVLGRGAPTLGAATVIGIAHSTISCHIIQNFASALTYIAFMLTNSDFERGHQLSEVKKKAELAKEKGVGVLLGVRDGIPPIELALDGGFSGVLLSGSHNSTELSRATEAFKNQGLLTVLRTDFPLSSPIGADLYLPRAASPTESFYAAARRLGKESGCASYRTLVPLSSSAGLLPPSVSAERPPRLSELQRFAYRRNTPILRDEDGRPYLTLAQVKENRRTHRTLLFEDLASIRKGLTVIGESLLAGIALELDGMPPAVAPLLSHSFEIIRR